MQARIGNRGQKVLIFEENLMWSVKIVKGLKTLGFDPIVIHGEVPEDHGATLAMVNLSDRKPDPKQLIPKLKSQGVTVIGHAGHKERELLELGRECGCDVVASNSAISNKLDQLLDQAISLGLG